MIEIICDKSTLEGTCYFEILPGKFKGECWNDDSIFFMEENFGYIMPAIEIWTLVVVELEQIKKYLTTNFEPSKLKDCLGFVFGSSEQELLSDLDHNVKQLISMIEQFQEWITEKSKTHQFISVLGI